jgi:bacteriocin-like protein
MKTEQRGSEKLMNSCSELSTLSQDELEQISGGALNYPHINIGSYKVWKVFPFGTIDPEILKVDTFLDRGLLERGISNGF